MVLRASFLVGVRRHDSLRTVNQSGKRPDDEVVASPPRLGRQIAFLTQPDERAQPELDDELAEQWQAIDDRIVATSSHSADDIRAKIGFLRWYQETDPSEDEEAVLLKGLLDDIERLFLAGGVA